MKFLQDPKQSKALKYNLVRNSSSAKEKEKLEAEKKLDALLQQQARPEENEEKPKIRQQQPTGKYW